MPIWSFRIAKLLCSSLAKRRLVPYGLSHTVTHSSRTELASEFNIHMMYAVFQDRMWAVELYMFWLQQLYQTIGPRTLLRQLNCSSWSCHPTLMPFWLQSACTLVLTLVSSTLSLEVCRSRVLKSVYVAHSKQTCIVGRAFT